MWRRMIWWKLVMKSGKSSLDLRRWLIIWLMGLRISTKNRVDSVLVEIQTEYLLNT
jgi:hypothetical protein